MERQALQPSEQLSRQYAPSCDMRVDRATRVGKRREASAVQAHDVELHGEEGERIVPWHQNPYGNAGIFDDLFEHLNFRTWPDP